METSKKGFEHWLHHLPETHIKITLLRNSVSDSAYLARLTTVPESWLNLAFISGVIFKIPDDNYDIGNGQSEQMPVGGPYECIPAEH